MTPLDATLADLAELERRATEAAEERRMFVAYHPGEDAEPYYRKIISIEHDIDRAMQKAWPAILSDRARLVKERDEARAEVERFTDMLAPAECPGCGVNDRDDEEHDDGCEWAQTIDMMCDADERFRLKREGGDNGSDDGVVSDRAGFGEGSRGVDGGEARAGRGVPQEREGRGVDGAVRRPDRGGEGSGPRVGQGDDRGGQGRRISHHSDYRLSALWKRATKAYRRQATSVARTLQDAIDRLVGVQVDRDQYHVERDAARAARDTAIADLAKARDAIHAARVASASVHTVQGTSACGNADAFVALARALRALDGES